MHTDILYNSILVKINELTTKHSEYALLMIPNKFWSYKIGKVTKDKNIVEIYFFLKVKSLEIANFISNIRDLLKNNKYRTELITEGFLELEKALGLKNPTESYVVIKGILKRKSSRVST